MLRASLLTPLPLVPQIEQQGYQGRTARISIRADIMGLLISTEEEASSRLEEDQEDDPSKLSDETFAVEEPCRAYSKEATNQSKKTKKARKRAAQRQSITRDRLEGARCIACNRVVTPPTIDGFEEHDQVCPAGMVR